MKTSRQNAGRRGFTLIELLTVITIIALLITILVPSVGAALKLAKLTKVRARIGELNGACLQYYNDFRLYPGQAYSGTDTKPLKLGADITQKQYSGSQVLAACLYEYTSYDKIEADDPQPTTRLLTYSSGDFLTKADYTGAGYASGSQVIKVPYKNVLSDRYSSQPMPILYFPAHLSGAKWVENDNKTLTEGKTANPFSQPKTTNADFFIMAPGLLRQYWATDMITNLPY
jgi:prepilin-type N-terminal cleavage/methylation domain-containing protein